MTNHRDLIGVRRAAELLGISPRRVQAIINQPCPECGHSGESPPGAPCARCHGQGQYLPAHKSVISKNSPWEIIRRDLELVKDRVTGRPKKTL